MTDKKVFWTSFLVSFVVVFGLGLVGYFFGPDVLFAIIALFCVVIVMAGLLYYFLSEVL